MNPQPSDPYRVYRNIVLVVVRGGASMLLGVMLILSFALAATQMPSGDTALRLSAVAVMAGIGAILIWLGIRIIGSRISAGSDGLFIHTVFRRCRFVPWGQVTGFQLVPAPRLNNQFTRTSVTVAVLRAHHGPLYCLGASFSEPSPAADAMLQSLQAEHQAWFTGHRTDAASTPSTG